MLISILVNYTRIIKLIDILHRCIRTGSPPPILNPRGSWLFFRRNSFKVICTQYMFQFKYLKFNRNISLMCYSDFLKIFLCPVTLQYCSDLFLSAISSISSFTKNIFIYYLIYQLYLSVLKKTMIELLIERNKLKVKDSIIDGSMSNLYRVWFSLYISRSFMLYS